MIKTTHLSDEPDIITKGISYATYAHQLESNGANVIGGVFLARTHYKVV